MLLAVALFAKGFWNMAATFAIICFGVTFIAAITDGTSSPSFGDIIGFGLKLWICGLVLLGVVELIGFG